MMAGLSGWMVFALPVGAVGLLFVALLLNSIRLYVKRRASLLAKLERQKKRQKKTLYARNDVLR